jgi:hypothetical protein
MQREKYQEEKAKMSDTSGYDMDEVPYKTGVLKVRMQTASETEETDIGSASHGCPSVVVVVALAWCTTPVVDIDPQHPTHLDQVLL